MAEKVNLGIIVSEFNYDITSKMFERAEEHAKFLGAEVIEVVKVPGVYDVPIAVKKLLKNGSIDAVVVLGAVIEGETEHDELVISQAARKMTDLSIEFEKPVSLGITGPGQTRMQAISRIDEYAKRATESAVKMVGKV